MIRLRRFTAGAQELHAIPMPVEGDDAELWVMRATGPANVMGSSQKRDRFDQRRLASDGVELASRRSGGGAVFIDPARVVWIDVVASRSSPWWSPELAENFLRVGRVWRQALDGLGVATELAVESPARTEASSLACWAGLGWGELSIDGAKIVGLSQRRTRWGSRVQAMAALGGSASRVGDYFADAGDRDTVRTALRVPQVQLDRDELEAAVIQAFRAG